MRRFALLAAWSFALLLLFALSPPSWADEASGLPPVPGPYIEEEAELELGPPELQAGRWEAEYRDTVLGVVTGLAEVAEDGSVSVTYTHPETGEPMVLRGGPARLEGDELVLRLSGRSPEAEPDRGDRLVGEPVVVEGKLQLVAGEAELQHEIAPRAEADLDTVELRFRQADDGVLAGTWSYLADPVTLRDRAGGGRVGSAMADGPDILEAADSGETPPRQYGPETWRRAVPEIYGALVVYDQSGQSGRPSTPFLLWPFDRRWFRPGDTGRLQGMRRERVIMVYGRNLPRERPVRLVSDEPSIGYNLLALPGQGDRIELERGFERLLARLPEEEHAAARKLDAVLVRARLHEGVKPGWQQFSLNDLPIRWKLQFSNVHAEVRFVRGGGGHATGDWQDRFVEPTSHFLLPETAHVEVRIGAETPFTELPVAIAVDGNIQSFDGAPVLMARRVGFDPKAEGTGVFDPEARVRRPPPVLYRTDPIPLRRAQAGTSHLPLRPGSVLHARVLHAGVLSGAAGIAEARMIDRPVAPLLDRGVIDWSRHDDLWEGALEVAAACHEDVQPWDLDAHVATLTNYLIARLPPVPQRIRVNVHLADHAAMLLLRDAFVAMMRDELVALSDIAYAQGARGDAALLGYRSMVRQAARLQSVPITEKLVTGPDGSKHSYSLALATHRVRSHLRLNEDAASTWIIQATREALRDYIADVRHSLAKARHTADCAVEDLLMLSGFSFEGVADYLKPWLVRPIPAFPAGVAGWEPNVPVRARVSSLGPLAAAWRGQQELALVDKQVAIVVGALVALPLFKFQAAKLGHMVAHGRLSPTTGAWVSRAISTAGLAVEVGDVAHIAFQEIPEIQRSRAEVRFALGAAAILGAGRLIAAESEERSWLEAAIAVIGGGYGLHVGLRQVQALPDVYASARWGPAYPAMKRGATLAARLRQGESALNRMTFRQRGDLFLYLDDANRVRQLGGSGALTPHQRRALADFDALFDAHWNPAWARNLDRRTLNELRRPGPGGIRLIHREDVRRLFGADPIAAQRVLREFGEDAFRILRYQPFSTADELGAAVRDWRNRVRRPVDGLYQRADLSDLSPHNNVDNLRERGWFLEVENRAPKSNDLPGTERFTVHVRHQGPQGDQTGKYLRSYNGTDGIFYFELAERHGLPSMLAGPEIEMIRGRGTPTTTYANLAAFNHAAIEFGGAGASQPLRQVVLETVVNIPNNVHMTWLRRVYGEVIPQEGLRQLFSVRYVESALNQAGFEIVRVTPRIDHRPGTRSLLGGQYPNHAGAATYRRELEQFGMSPARAEQMVDDLMTRFFGPNWRARGARGERYLDAFDIEIDVRPMRESGSWLPVPSRLARYMDSEIEIPATSPGWPLELPNPGHVNEIGEGIYAGSLGSHAFVGARRSLMNPRSPWN